MLWLLLGFMLHKRHMFSNVIFHFHTQQHISQGMEAIKLELYNCELYSNGNTFKTYEMGSRN